MVEGVDGGKQARAHPPLRRARAVYTTMVAAVTQQGGIGVASRVSRTAAAASGATAAQQLSFVERMLCGAVARGVAQTTLHPVDVMRTRLQVRKITSKLELRTFLKGVIPQITLAVPAGAIQFVAFELAREELAKLDPDNKFGSARQLIAGAIGALSAAVVRVPQEVCKQRIQADIYPNVAVAVREIMAADGIAGFYKGWLATISRDVPWNALSFLFHGETKKVFTLVTKKQPDDRQNLLLASFSGMLAAMIMTPIDVAKTRIMTQRAGEAVKYSGLVNTIRIVMQEEGVAALFKGTIPRVMYLAPLAGITLSVYEAISKQILRRKASARSASLKTARGMRFDNRPAPAVCLL
ncbi:putative S-adenosylmethionine carrier 2, chloroplastic [Porphyridium purpureum]|uniref:Putative S-adenosylmethionine carrier 2, chloroplastic n=1 Tax=Porphyridium purpureum TaxID=35688 RepID=A0A5J4YTJ2_PORPP|nr:putative S-adenosylmethionine carrier 2, chloroplastic [Porphyridium purpureum]|eukprot:POR7776..scf229_5